MKFRQLLPVLMAVLMMGAPVSGESSAGTPVSMKSPTAPATTGSPAEPSAAEAPWAAVVITDDLEKNDKTAFYPVKPAGEKVIGNGRLTAFFSSALPEGVRESLRYTRYPVAHTYLMRLDGGALTVKAGPDPGAPVVRTAGRFQTLAADGIVQGASLQPGGSRDWYRVRWEDAGIVQEGYVYAEAKVVRRGFQFSKMAQAIERLRVLSDSGAMAHVDNYKNRAGWAPARAGKTADDYGVLRDQAAPVYYQPDTLGDFRYLTDGSLVRVLGELEAFYEIEPVDFGGVYYIPKKFLHRESVLKSLKKVIVVDRNNQNEAVFEYGQGWQLISYQLATTGENAPFKQETSLGNFMVLEKKSKFLYLGDLTKVVEGYAPYALRFNGGAYVHGVPVNYKTVRQRVVVTPPVLDAAGGMVAPAVTRDVVVGKKDPGIQEFLSTIGTVPRSHKCVRNYTSHALFLYNWAEIGNTAVIVIE